MGRTAEEHRWKTTAVLLPVYNSHTAAISIATQNKMKSSAHKLMRQKKRKGDCFVPIFEAWQRASFSTCPRVRRQHTKSYTALAAENGGMGEKCYFSFQFSSFKSQHEGTDSKVTPRAFLLSTEKQNSALMASLEAMPLASIPSISPYRVSTNQK